MVQGIGLTVNVTGTICGPVLTVKVSIPLYVPGARPAVFTLTEGEAGVEALVWLKWSQPPPLVVRTEALQFWLVVQPRATLMRSVCAAGEAPP